MINFLDNEIADCDIQIENAKTAEIAEVYKVRKEILERVREVVNERNG